MSEFAELIVMVTFIFKVVVPCFIQILLLFVYLKYDKIHYL